MKQLLLVALIGLTAFGVNAQVNTNTLAVPSLSLTNAVEETGKTSGGWELTLGGGGETFKGESYFGLDFSLSTNPFKNRPEVWVGVAQSLYWEPTLAGSTDLFVDWSLPILPSKLDERLYLNVGWSGGALYDNQGSEAIWRTGPEATFQYYTSDNAFIYAGVNYDVFKSGHQEGGWRYSFGIGLSF